MTQPTNRVRWPTALAIVGVSAWTATLSGCGEGAEGPAFTADPRIEMAPNPDAPLGGRLTLSTDVATRVTATIQGAGLDRRIRFNGFDTDHRLTLLGFHPDGRYRVQVAVEDRAGALTRFDGELTVTTPPLPADFPDLQVDAAHTDAARMEPGFTLFDTLPEGDSGGPLAYLIMVDKAGRVVWYYRSIRLMDPRQRSEGRIMALLRDSVVEIDMLGETVRQWRRVDAEGKTKPGAGQSFHHEAFPTANGNLLVLSVEKREITDFPASASDLGQTETAQVAGDVVVELTPSGTVVNSWKLLDMLDPRRIGYNFDYNFWKGVFDVQTRDWSHANAVIEDPGDDGVIVSLRHQDAVIKFHRDTGEVEWILGDPQNWDAPLADRLLTPAAGADDFYPYHQHAPELLPNGHLLLYDNGNHRAVPPTAAKPRPWYSRAVEYRIDEDAMTAEKVWEYSGVHNGRRYFAGALGDADYLPQTGNVLINHGSLNDVDSAVYNQGQFSAHIIEVTRSASPEEVFRLMISDQDGGQGDGWRVYRAERVPSLYSDAVATAISP